MAVNRAIIKGVNILIAISLCLFVAFISFAINNLVRIGTMLSDVNSDSELSSTTDTQIQAPLTNFTRGQLPADNNPEHSQQDRYETIEETIARIKKDVIVTGTIKGVSGEEVAYFQIEGMKDRAFLIDTQLMDGFIIEEITNSYVVLKNQVGDETFYLHVQSGE